jgi:phosphoribosyl 1,2-cyclic phosphodiesterase
MATLATRFFGVRGSIATAGDDTRRYGGNTSCVSVQAGSHSLIFDAGTGIRALGQQLARNHTSDIHLFLSHVHWDHIQGFPFFVPAFMPSTELHIYGGDDHRSVQSALSSQMSPPNFPVGLGAMRAKMCFTDIQNGATITLGSGDDRVEVRHVDVDHPNGCVAYRVDCGGHSIVYATDLELAQGQQGTIFQALANLAHGADLLIFDAMYTPEEYQTRRGWGHSTFDMGAALAEASQVQQLCLFHHDPTHDDAFMDELGARAQTRFAATTVAREGMGFTW